MVDDDAADALLEASAVRQLLVQPASPCVVVLEQCESTMDEAASLAAQGCVSGTVVAARRQTAGRGRHDRRFASNLEGNAFLSVVIRPGATLGYDLPRMMGVFRAANAVAPLAVAAACCSELLHSASTALRPTSCLRSQDYVLSVLDTAVSLKNPAVQIRWPNDVMVGELKVAVPCEAAPDGLEYVGILGVGINANRNPADFEPELQGVSCALANYVTRRISLAVLIASVCNAFHLLSSLLSSQIQSLFHDLDALRGKKILVEAHTECFEGIAEGVSGTWELLVRRASSGDVETVVSAVRITALP